MVYPQTVFRAKIGTNIAIFLLKNVSCYMYMCEELQFIALASYRIVINLVFYDQGKHLHSCRDGQFLTHPLPLQACGGILPVFFNISN